MWKYTLPFIILALAWIAAQLWAQMQPFDGETILYKSSRLSLPCPEVK